MPIEFQHMPPSAAVADSDHMHSHDNRTANGATPFMCRSLLSSEVSLLWTGVPSVQSNLDNWNDLLRKEFVPIMEGF